MPLKQSATHTEQKMKFSIRDFLMENFIFCAVSLSKNANVLSHRIDELLKTLFLFVVFIKEKQRNKS